MNLTDVADNVQGDWVILAQQLGVTMSDINRIKMEYTTLADQALAMLQLWVQKNREKATGGEDSSAELPGIHNTTAWHTRHNCLAYTTQLPSILDTTV